MFVIRLHVLNGERSGSLISRNAYRIPPHPFALELKGNLSEEIEETLVDFAILTISCASPIRPNMRDHHESMIDLDNTPAVQLPGGRLRLRCSLVQSVLWEDVFNNDGATGDIGAAA